MAGGRSISWVCLGGGIREKDYKEGMRVWEYMGAGLLGGDACVGVPVAWIRRTLQRRGGVWESDA